MKAVPVIFAFGLFVDFACRGNLQLPEPPQQHKSWHPDRAVATNMLSAVETLYRQGFPDPRGCEYRGIEVEVSGVWNSKRAAIKTRGWVLPATKSRDTNRFAICWNGLVYPVAQISAAADLRSESSKVDSSSRLGWRHNAAAGEEQTVLISGALSTRIPLLLRCGETTAESTNWSSNPQTRFGGRGNQVENQDPYLEFAGDWAWAMFDRTICAHMRGDEALALATARQLAAVQPKIEAECVRRGFRKQKDWSSPGQGKERPYLDFLEQFPQLLADLERRGNEGPRVGVLDSGLPRQTDQTKRIAALIRDLDMVEARQWGQPGGINLAEDATVAAFIQEGDAAVEPLLDCLEADKRLTRSVGFGRSFFRGRRVIPVSSAATTALQTILHAGFGGGSAEIRAYWNKYKGLKLEERWYAILQDDAAGNRWLEAAGSIVQPENETTFPYGFSTTKPAPTNLPVRLRGEILRRKSSPSVGELMTRRALEVPAANPNAYDLSAACEMGLRLAAWDHEAAGTVARTLSQRCRTVMQYSSQNLGGFIAKLAMVRSRAGEATAFEDYAAWLPTTTPGHLEHSLWESLEPLREFSTNQTVQATAERLFGNTNTPWSTLPWTQTGFDDPAGSALVNLPAFRTLLARELDRKDVCGTIWLVSSGMVRFEITNHMNMNGSRGIALPPDTHATTGTQHELRWCDWIAWSLSNGNSIPAYDPFASVDARNAAIEKAKSLLRRN